MCGHRGHSLVFIRCLLCCPWCWDKEVTRVTNTSLPSSFLHPPPPPAPSQGFQFWTLDSSGYGWSLASWSCTQTLSSVENCLGNIHPHQPTRMTRIGEEREARGVALGRGSSERHWGTKGDTSTGIGTGRKLGCVTSSWPMASDPKLGIRVPESSWTFTQ